MVDAYPKIDPVVIQLHRVAIAWDVFKVHVRIIVHNVRSISEVSHSILWIKMDLF